MAYTYTTKEIWALAYATKDEEVYINEDGYQIKFNGEYFSEWYGGKIYGVAITKITDKWVRVE